MGVSKKQIQGYIKTFLSTVGAPADVSKGIDLFFSIMWEKPSKATANDLTALQLQMPHKETWIFFGQDPQGRPIRVLVQAEPGAIPPEALSMLKGGE